VVIGDEAHNLRNQKAAVVTGATQRNSWAILGENPA
jgi:hypothetical protein